ncbi:unnamed protein product [Haemonchus placei]|uniref:Uncharacterized protein n=1 Tax=Haemonchus placei TaxID=6290 RepID=A0A3P7X6Y8_HAEPC|nr:unnamed protein product [Haemonchus placei]
MHYRGIHYSSVTRYLKITLTVPSRNDCQLLAHYGLRKLVRLDKLRTIYFLAFIKDYRKFILTLFTMNCKQVGMSSSSPTTRTIRVKSIPTQK